MRRQVVRGLVKAWCVASITTVVAGAFGTAAWGAAGDLDPGFGDVGRVSVPGLMGPAWSIEPQLDSGLVIAGGYTFRDEYRMAYGYVARLLDTGIRDSDFTVRGGVEFLDAAVRPDGKIVAVGRISGAGLRSFYVVARLERDGLGDPGFTRLMLYGGGRAAATSVALDPDGRILAAGFVGNNLVVVRLLENGDYDNSFATNGTFVRPVAFKSFFTSIYPRTAILRTDGGGYRVLLNDTPDTTPKCSVLALTASGTLDESFGELGYARLGASEDASVTCMSMTPQRDGRLLVAGTEGGAAFVARLMSGGEVDTGFDAGEVAEVMMEARAIAVGGDDGIIVAGSGPSGASVARVNTDGTLDDRFGMAGTTWIDMPNDGDAFAVANDVAILAGGEVLVAGGFGSRAFVARLLGSDGIDGPGVLGIVRTGSGVTEGDGRVLLTVRRMGGRAGAIEVSYRSRTDAGAEFPATEGEDYSAVSGQLQWADGDASDRQILVPIAPDGGWPEEQESFQVELQEATGGAGLGSRVSTVAIAADGAPAGLFAIGGSEERRWGEGGEAVRIEVQRNYYASGAVSVTVNPTSGTAASGQDFSGEPVMVSWSDGEMGSKYVDIPVQNDTDIEQDETFSAALSAATGGAVIGPRSTVTITIVDDDRTMTNGPSPTPSPPSLPSQPSGGGGRTGWLSVLLLSLGSLARSRLRRAS
jgi:uncharacterized delta-60 repeat protein